MAAPACLASAPFNKPEADVILHSADGVEFRVVSWILKDASPIFADTLNIPQASSPRDPAAEAAGPQDPAHNALRDSLQATNFTNTSQPSTINLTESSATLEVLLRLCYPSPPIPSFASFDEAKPLIRAAHKYEMQYAIRALEQAILPHVASDPVSVYAFATRYGLADTMRAAAQAWLSNPSPWEYRPDLEDISAGSYNRLITYRENCKTALTIRLSSTWGPRGTCSNRYCRQWTWYGCTTCVPRPLGLVKYYGGCIKCCPGRTAEWFSKFKDRVNAALAVTPVIGVLEDPGLTVDVLQQAFECGTCRAVVHQQMRELMDLLIRAAKEELSKVSLEIKS